MQIPLLLAQMILAIALIASILLQQRGTGLGGAFGGEVTAYRSRRGIERTLFRLTIVLAVLFVAFSLLNLVPADLTRRPCYHRPSQSEIAPNAAVPRWRNRQTR